MIAFITTYRNTHHAIQLPVNTFVFKFTEIVIALTIVVICRSSYCNCKSAIVSIIVLLGIRRKNNGGEE